MPKFSLEKARESSEQFNKLLKEKVMSDPELKSLYERKRCEIALAISMRKAREKEHITQEEIAARMHTTKSTVSRLESSGVSRHSPSLDTLLKYAHALGYDLKIDFVPSDTVSASNKTLTASS